MSLGAWYLFIGLLLISIVLTRSRIQRMPINPAMLYLGLGLLAGYMGWITFDPIEQSHWLELASELAVIISLFSAGLKLRLPLRDPLWRFPIALAFGSMTITVGLVVLVGVWLFDLPLGVAVILGAVLSPTDPVLAAEVQVEHPGDHDRLRFSLTAEAGLNDGTAFPFVMLGLGLLGLHELGEGGMQWVGRDVLWAVAGGLGIGGLLGSVVSRLVLFLRQKHKEAVGVDDFVALGLIATSYGAALSLHTYGFLAVFAAGLALRRTERELSGSEPALNVKSAIQPDHELATHPEKAPGYLASAVLDFNEQLERIAELALVLVTGAMLAQVGLSGPSIVAGVALLFIIRPVATAGMSLLFRVPRRESMLSAWFGIRGVGSIYYLFYAVNHGLERTHADVLVAICVPVIAFSVCLHGITAVPLLKGSGAAPKRSPVDTSD